MNERTSTALEPETLTVVLFDFPFPTGRMQVRLEATSNLAYSTTIVQ